MRFTGQSVFPKHIHTKNKCKAKFEMRHKENQVEEKQGCETKEAMGIMRAKRNIWRYVINYSLLETFNER